MSSNEAKKRGKKRYYSRTAYSQEWRSFWTGAQDRMVMDHVCTDTELSHMIGRSVMSIQIRRHRLKKGLWGDR